MRNGKQKGHTYLDSEIFYGGQKLHTYFCSLQVRPTAIGRQIYKNERQSFVNFRGKKNICFIFCLCLAMGWANKRKKKYEIEIHPWNTCHPSL